MANTHSPWFPKLLAQGFMALRQNAVAPRYVNRAYEREGGQVGSTITIPVPSAITAAAVTPGPTQPANVDLTSTSKTISLDQWYEARFYLSDKDKLEVARGFMPTQASEAIKAIANNIDSAILANYVSVYGHAGTGGTDPFATDLSEFLTARKNLANQLAPLSPRFCLINPDAEANALGLRAFQDASFGAGTVLREGDIGRKLGADWAMDQNIPDHTAGSASGATCALTAGNTTATLDSAGTGNILAGDAVTIAGNQYAVVTGDTDVSDGGTIVLDHAPAANAVSGTAITVAASGAVNIVAHRDAFAFVNRPLAESDDEGLGRFMSNVDPVSGIALRLEVIRGYKQTIYSFDVLYGTALPRPEYASRLLGA